MIMRLGMCLHDRRHSEACAGKEMVLLSQMQEKACCLSGRGILQRDIRPVQRM